jgi:hypothetical protein
MLRLNRETKAFAQLPQRKLSEAGILERHDLQAMIAASHEAFFAELNFCQSRAAMTYLTCEQGIRQSIEPYAREIREIEEKPAETPDRATERSPRPALRRVPPIT